jgi:hypothetical protein
VTATVAQIRQRIAAGVKAQLGATWRESAFPPSLLTQDGAAGFSRVMSVEAIDTAWIAESRTRASRQTGPMRLRTTILVRLAWRLALDAGVEAVDDLLDAEASVFAALPTLTWTGSSGPDLDSITRGLSPDGAWMITTLRLAVQHTVGAP